jgi:hypothetical protein
VEFGGDPSHASSPRAGESTDAFASDLWRADACSRELASRRASHLRRHQSERCACGKHVPHAAHVGVKRDRDRPHMDRSRILDLAHVALPLSTHLYQRPKRTACAWHMTESAKGRTQVPRQVHQFDEGQMDARGGGKSCAATRSRVSAAAPAPERHPRSPKRHQPHQTQRHRRRQPHQIPPRRL